VNDRQQLKNKNIRIVNNFPISISKKKRKLEQPSKLFPKERLLVEI